jgi:hypothetical protein
MPKPVKNRMQAQVEGKMSRHKPPQNVLLAQLFRLFVACALALAGAGKGLLKSITYP